MENKTKNKFNLSSSALTKQLCGILALVTVFCVVGFIMTTYNIRKPTNLTYDDETNAICLDTIDFNNTNQVFLANKWILVPNINNDNLRYGLGTSINRYKDFPHIENLTISSGGWYSAGDDAVYVDMDKNTKFDTAMYLTRLYLGPRDESLFLNIPSLNGRGKIYCNGILIKEFGNEHDTGRRYFDFNGGNINVEINKSSEQTLELAILIESETNVKECGIISYPSVGNLIANNRFTEFNNAWFFFEVAVYILSITGAVILSFTFRYKSKMYLFVSVSALMFLYICIDNRYLYMTAHTRNAISFIVLTLHGILSYAFTNSIFSYQAKTKPFLTRWHDTGIIMFVGICLLLPRQINADKIASNSDFTAITAFLITISVISLLKTIYIIFRDSDNDKNTVIGLFTSVSMCFVYLYVAVKIMYIYYIPMYSVFFAIALFSMQLCFVIYYVIQFRELALTSKNLQVLVDRRTEQLSKTNKELTETNAQLVENELARKNVMSNVSHDLKTPITAIKGYAQLLLTDRSTMSEEQVTNYASSILKRANQMERLIADIIELTKLQSGGLSFKMFPLSISQMLEETYYMYDGDMSLHGKKLLLDIPKEDLLTINADPNKLVRIFENLISNAIHYTNEDGIINVKAYRETDTNKIIVEISDNGIGIPEDDVSHIFDRFYRAKNSGKNIKGTGLGLAIVKLIADKHNIQIIVNSILNEGTTFKLVCNPYSESDSEVSTDQE